MRDKKGRFQKHENGGIYIDLSLLTIKKVINWFLLIIILLPWIAIVSKFNICDMIVDFIQQLMRGLKKEDPEATKKNGIFIKSLNSLI